MMCRTYIVWHQGPKIFSVVSDTSLISVGNDELSWTVPCNTTVVYTWKGRNCFERLYLCCTRSFHYLRRKTIPKLPVPVKLLRYYPLSNLSPRLFRKLILNIPVDDLRLYFNTNLYHFFLLLTTRVTKYWLGVRLNLLKYCKGLYLSKHRDTVSSIPPCWDFNGSGLGLIIVHCPRNTPTTYGYGVTGWPKTTGLW